MQDYLSNTDFSVHNIVVKKSIDTHEIVDVPHEVEVPGKQPCAKNAAVISPNV
jgi:hypothetical protein